MTLDLSTTVNTLETVRSFLAADPQRAYATSAALLSRAGDDARAGVRDAALDYTLAIGGLTAGLDRRAELAHAEIVLLARVRS